MGFLSGIVGSVAGGFIDSAFGKSNAKYSAGLSYDNWVKQQSNAHQLEVQDLRKAGLNPILSATNSQMAGMGSAVPISTGSSANTIMSSVNSSKQIKQAEKALEQEFTIAGKKLDIDQLNAATRLKEVENNRLLIDSQVAFNNASSMKSRFDVYAGMKRLPYETDLLAANAEAARSAASLSLANISVAASQVGLNNAQRDRVVADLKDPKKLASKAWWYKVFNSNEKEYEVIRKSFYRGMENDVIFSFGSGSGSTDFESLTNMLRNGKYVLSKGR